MDTRIRMPHYLLRTVCFVPWDPKKALAFYLNSPYCLYYGERDCKGSHAP